MFIFYVLVRMVMFSGLRQWPYVGEILWDPVAQTPLINRAIYDIAVPPVWTELVLSLCKADYCVCGGGGCASEWGWPLAW